MNVFKQIVTRAMRPQVSKLDHLYQRHAGEECYLFGDGVSLKWMDLREFADRPSIIASMGIYHRDLRALKVPYCAITEPYWFWPIYPSRYNPAGKLPFVRHRLHEEYRKSINANPDILFFVNVSNYPVIRAKNIQFVSRWYQPPFVRSNVFRDRSDAQDGTLKFQLSLAIFLGFTHAILIGHDYTHFPAQGRHFYELGEGRPAGVRYFSQDFLEYAKQYIDLTVVTLGATSETMKSMTYTELTGKEPRFHENTDIVDKNKLESLTTWRGGYEIF